MDESRLKDEVVIAGIKIENSGLYLGIKYK